MTSVCDAIQSQLGNTKTAPVSAGHNILTPAPPSHVRRKGERKRVKKEEKGEDDEEKEEGGIGEG